MRQSLTIDQITRLVSTLGQECTYLIEGHMGSGKSSILANMKKANPGAYNYVYLDCTQLDVGDVQCPVPNADKSAISFLPNEMFFSGGDVPLCLMFDELGKANRQIQNVCLPIIHERRVGNRKLPSGSIVFATTNLGAEGVGDTMLPHVVDRMTVVEMAKPQSEAWIDWGMRNNVHPIVLAFAQEFPSIFADFRDVKNASDNKYIFHPQAQRRKFITHRGMERVSHHMHAAEKLGDSDALHAAIAGTVGDCAAADLMAYSVLFSHLPQRATVIQNPTGASVPDNPAACIMMAYNAVGWVNRTDLGNIVTYIKRLPQEIQALFATQVMRNRDKQSVACTHNVFKTFVLDNGWMLM